MAQDQGTPASPEMPTTSHDRAAEVGRGAAGALDRPTAELGGRLKRLRGPIVAIAALGAVLSGFVGYWNVYRAVHDGVASRSTQPASVAPAFSVALMPFVPATEKPEEQKFANALTDHIHALYGNAKLVRLASARAVQEYKGDHDPRSIGRALNVRYLADGAVRILDGKTTIMLQLADCESGTQIWSQRLTADESASGEDRRLAAAIDVSRVLTDALYDKEEQRALAHPIPGSAVDLFLQGSVALRTNGNNSAPKLLATRSFFDDALRIDPDFLPALRSLAVLLRLSLADDLDSDMPTRAKRIDELDRITARMVAIDGGYSTVWYERANALGWLGRFDQALEANGKARDLAPYPDSGDIDQQAEILQSLNRLDEALALNAPSASMFHAKNSGQEGSSHRTACTSNLLVGRYAVAVAECEKSAANDDWWMDQVYLTAGYAQLGDLAKAAAAKSALLGKKPTFTIEKWKRIDLGTPGYAERAEAHVYAGLRKAGIPER